VEFARSGKTAVLAVYDVGDLEAIKKYNSITLDKDGVITFLKRSRKSDQHPDGYRALLFPR